MPRPVDLKRLRARSLSELHGSIHWYNYAVTNNFSYTFVRWTAAMTTVQLHAVWERFAEARLVSALNHSPAHFLRENAVAGVKRIPAGLAKYLARNGGRYFDFRSTADLIDRADRLVGKADNPFRSIAGGDKAYLDTLAAIRNLVVHKSEAARVAYKRALKATYGISSTPEPEEFLNSKDNRTSSPKRYDARLNGLVTVVTRTIGAT